jgi:hypothetical protein
MKKLALTLILLAPFAARADDTKLPFNPYEKAEKGDWAILTGTLRAKGSGEKTKLATYSRVLAADGDNVRVSEQSQAGAVDKSARSFSKKEAPSIMHYFALEEGKISETKIADEEREVCGKKLATKKLTFKWTKDNEVNEVAAWLSPEVRGGLAAMEMRSTGGHGAEPRESGGPLETAWKLSLGGCGTAEKKEMGESPEDLLEDAMLGEPDETSELPFNPVANAKEGDWAAYKFTLDDGEHSQVMVMDYEVTAATKTAVTLAQTVHDKGRAEKREVELSRTKLPLAGEFVRRIFKDTSEELPVSHVKLATEKHTVSDREFECQKLSFTINDRTARLKVKLWLSADVKAPAIVALEIKGNEHGRDVGATFELGGYGSEDKTEWGKTAEQLTKKKRKKSDDDE